jgi:hypothetical protein
MNRPNRDAMTSASREFRRKLVEHDPARQVRRTLTGIVIVIVVLGLAVLVALVPADRFYPLIRSLLNRGN